MTIKLTGDWSKCKAAMAAMASLDFGRVHRKIGAYLVDDVVERFDTGTAPDGSAWRTSARAEAESGQTLVDDAVLRNSISYRATARHAEVGTNVKYARIHQYGGVIRPRTATHLQFRMGGSWRRVKKVTIPARPFLGLRKEHKDEAIKILKREIERRLQ